MLRFTLSLALTVATVVPTAALAKDSAVSFGATTSLNPSGLANFIGLLGLETVGDGDALALFTPGAFGTPTFDIRADELVVQVHILDTIGLLAAPGADEVIYLGGNVFTMPWNGNLAGKDGHFEAFAGIGGSVDFVIAGGDGMFQVGPVAPIGVRFGGKRTRFALYTLPGIDVVIPIGGGDVALVVPSAHILGSVWF